MHLARELFREYQAAVDAPVCFTAFDAELATLPEPYLEIWVAWVDGVSAGCVALKSLSDDVAEVKRLYVRPGFRRLSLGHQLMAATLDAARERGFARLRLDTLPSMPAAIAMYQQMGFVPIERYSDNPYPGTLFFELPLRAPSSHQPRQ